MPHDIIDNRSVKLLDTIKTILPTAESAKFAVGYFFLSGLKAVEQEIANIRSLRLLIGSTSSRQTTYQHDRLGRRTGLTNPLSKTWMTTYSDVSGGLRTVLDDGAGNDTQRDTDRLGRLSAIDYLSESPKLTPDVAFAYDLAGNRTKMTESDGAGTVRETLYTYDAARRLTQVGFDTDGDSSIEATVAYEYDGSGPRTRLVLPDGKAIEYEYDVTGRLVKMTDWDGQDVRYFWDLAGRLIEAVRSNELRSRWHHDAAGRLTRLLHEQRGAVVARFDYTVDARGNRRQAVETILQPDDTIDVQTIDYAYDALSRLIEADYGSRKYEYAYDLAGNRTQKKVTVGTTTTTNYTYNAANQLTSDGTNTLTYDDNGNLTSDGTNAYTWDRANRLLSMGGISYEYDGMGNRVSQTANSIVTQYLLDVQPGLVKVLAETTSGATTRYIHGPRGLERQLNPTTPVTWTFALQDGLGSVRGVVDNDWADMAVLGTRMYAPYGVPFGAEGAMSTAFGFTGEMTDDNELVFLRARYLNPGLGVFASRDPVEGRIRQIASLNKYSYAQNNPVRFTDPTGNVTRDQIEQGRVAYSCNCGWIDYGHTGSGIEFLKALDFVFSQADASRLEYWGIDIWLSMSTAIQSFSLTAYPFMDIAIIPITTITSEKSHDRKLALATSIYMSAQERFEYTQGQFPYSLSESVRESSFAEEDLISDLLGFYKGIQKEMYGKLDYEVNREISELCKVFDKQLSLHVWEEIFAKVVDQPTSGSDLSVCIFG